MRYHQILNHFNFLCLTIRQGSQYQRNNKVIKILQSKKIYRIIDWRPSNLEILPRVSLIWCQFFEFIKGERNGFHGFSSLLFTCFIAKYFFIYFVMEVFISFTSLEKPANVWNQSCSLIVDATYQSDDANQTQLVRL